MKHAAISLPYAFVPRHKRSTSHLLLASRQERCQVRLADSIVMYLRGSAAVCGVNVVSRIVVVIALQATSHLPLTLELLLYGYFRVCFAVEVRGACFWGDIKTTGNEFLTLPYYDPSGRLC